MSLAAKGDIVVFEHYERCQPAFLTVLSNLVQRGKARWPGATYCRTAAGGRGQRPCHRRRGRAHATGQIPCAAQRGPLLPNWRIFGAPFVSALGDICETAAPHARKLVRCGESGI